MLVSVAMAPHRAGTVPPSVAATVASSAFRRGALFWRLRPFGAAWRVEMETDVLVQGIVWVPGCGRVILGRRVRLLGRRAPIELRAHPGARICIEDDVVIEAGASIEATHSIHIGAGAHIGAFCKVIDNNFHRTTGDRTERPEPVPVLIGEGAVVGPRAVLLPGTALGARARVAPGSVVSFRVPAGGELGGEAHFPRGDTPRQRVA